MRRSLMLATVLAVSSAILGACEPKTNAPENKPPVTTPSPAVSPSASPSGSPVTTAPGNGKVDDKKIEAWTGKWTGVEGTYLNIAKKGDKYSIEIANLDGPKTYEGTAKDSHIEFTRNGKTETIRAATGDETGMKYLAGKKNCLVVTKGSEGFCKE